MTFAFVVARHKVPKQSRRMGQTRDCFAALAMTGEKRTRNDIPFRRCEAQSAEAI